ncbi:PH domain-containing protein [Ectobacillus panaciterrae]|uniref:PH domain-containing protein n=1 Tax=Ectobacillus panaciterrae TaxID=363872 RepID=UPI0003FA7071|nr:PH domain-containing protein [Ectobacillus panaciterrae]
MKFSVKKHAALTGTSIALTPIGLLLLVLGTGGSSLIRIACIALGIVCVTAGTILLWALNRSYLEITEEHLVNHFGPFKSQINLERITAIRFVKDPASGFAWTFLRIQVMLHPHKQVTIALPEDKNAFIMALKQKCPDAEIAYMHFGA